MKIEIKFYPTLKIKKGQWIEITRTQGKYIEKNSAEIMPQGLTSIIIPNTTRRLK